MSHCFRYRITAARCALLVAPLAVFAAACTEDHAASRQPYDATRQIASNATDGGRLDPDNPLEITAKGGDGRITDVTATDTAGRYVRGELSADGSRWHSTSPLAADAHYTVRVKTENGDGAPGRRILSFDTRPAADKRLRVSFGPESGTYGVGQPVTATLSRPIKGEARATVERALKVDSRPGMEGSWYWVDGKTLHYRPREFWPAHATIDVHSNLKGIRIAKGLYGDSSKPLRLRIGDRVEAITDAAKHEMTVKRNGKVIRTLPVTTGKPGFETRNGIKVVLAKEPYVRMRSSTVGIAAGSGDSYDLGVYWATRVTWSGEYVHAAPWSVGSQGSANVSHGCTGMSTADAKWFFKTVRLGDIVRVVNSHGERMTPFDNGFGDWNLDWNKWRSGSATGPGGGLAGSARLRPET